MLIFTCFSGDGNDGGALLPPAHVVDGQHAKLVLSVGAAMTTISIEC